MFGGPVRADRISYCPLDRVLTYKNLIYLLILQVVKTFIISKFNHLFVTLPNPSPEMIKSISDIMYKFIWNGKPDKVNRQQICKDYLGGGFKNASP